MVAFIPTIILGLIICFIGVGNMKGNISSLHSYHRNRVKEEDVKPFGKRVGIGMMIIGISVIVMGALSILAVLFENESYTLLGTAVMIGGLVVGCIISFRAMIKYNGGIF